jgi:hypothetical protein
MTKRLFLGEEMCEKNDGKQYLQCGANGKECLSWKNVANGSGRGNPPEIAADVSKERMRRSTRKAKKEYGGATEEGKKKRSVSPNPG